MKTKNLNQEINNLLTSIEKSFGKNSREYQDAEYCFDILETVYRCNYDEGKDLLNELQKLFIRLSDKLPDLASDKLSLHYPGIDEMRKYLKKWLSN